MTTALRDGNLGWILVGTLDDIPRRGARCIAADVMAIAVFRTGDERIFAREDRCPTAAAR